MFDIGWTVLLVIGVVALIVVGPKDLPGMFRTLGRFTAKARSMARDFSRAMEDAADESGVKDVAKDLKSMTSMRNLGLDKIQQAATSFENWDPVKSDSGAKKGPATAALAEKRAEATQKIHKKAHKARKSTKKSAKSAAAAKPAKAASKKPATQKSGSKKAAPKPAPKPARKTAAKPASKTVRKPATRITTATKPAENAAE